jgi:hypothetical protein
MVSLAKGVSAISAVRAIADGGKSDGTAQSRRLRVVRRAISRALAGANAFARPRAGLRSLAFPSMVMDLPKEVPKSAASSPQHADTLALGAVTSF